MHVKALKFVLLSVYNLQLQFQKQPLDRDQPEESYFDVTKVYRHNPSYQIENFEGLITQFWASLEGLRWSNSDLCQGFYSISRKNITFERSVHFHTFVVK